MNQTAAKIITTLEELDRFAEAFLKKHRDGGVFGLSGDLGAGKTTFVRALISSISKANGKEVPRVTSPSYVLHQSYSLSPSVDHFDLYRLEAISEETLWEMGYFDALDKSKASKGFVFVEWPEKVKQTAQLQLQHTLRFHHLPNGAREITG